jgi:hypothetical protein
MADSRKEILFDYQDKWSKTVTKCIYTAVVNIYII